MNFNSYSNPRNFVPRERNSVSRNFSSSSPSRTGMTPFPAVTPLGMAYVPFQSWGEVNSLEKAFSSGSLFPELCFPFEEGGRK